MSRPTFRWVADSPVTGIESGVMTLAFPDRKVTLRLSSFGDAWAINGAIERTYTLGAADARAELAARVRQALGPSGA